MSTSSSPSETPETEELVAYLDGELSAEESRRVERRLASDGEYRRRLMELEQAWVVLEELPQPTVDDDFARTTIEMVAVAAERDASAASAAAGMVARRRQYVAAAIGLALVALAFVAARRLFPGPDAMLVNDLPAIAQLDALQQVKDLAFLRGLTKLDFDAADNGSGEANRMTPRLVSSESWQSPAERRRWIEELPTESKAELATLLERFTKLAPAARDRLLRLEREIEDAPDRAELERALSEYAAWIQRRTPGEQTELRELSSAERLSRVEQLLNENQREPHWQLSPEDERALQEGVLEFVAQRKESIVRDRPEMQRRLAEQPSAMVALTIVGMEMRDDGGRRRLQDLLTARLSPAAQDYYENLSDRQKRWQLRRWMFAALQPKLGPEELKHYFTNELTNDQREYLLGLSQQEMEDQLQQLYMRTRIGLRGGEWGGGFGRPGEFGRGGAGPGGPPDWDRDRGERGPGSRRGGPGRELDGERFERPPFPPGPGGWPPGGPAPDGRGWPPPRDGGPPPEEPI